MSFTLRNRRFSPTVFGTVLMLAGVAVFLRLGVWQLDRAQEKRDLIEQFEAGAQSTLAVTSLASVNSLPRYQRVEVRGRYDAVHQILLDNMPSQHGRAGYRVLTPLELEHGGWLLVDRGWIAPGATRAELPNIDVAESPRSVTGVLDQLPEPGIRLGGGVPEVSAPWPQVFNFPQQEQLEHALQRPVAMRILLLDASAPDGFERAWRPAVRVGPGRHIAYAVQWFAFTLAALTLYFLMSMKPRPTDPKADRT